MVAYGYIRKSVVHDPTRMLSPEMQEAAIKRLATANGDEDVVILSDLDISGRKGRSARPGWNELLHAVEDGVATSVYAYSLSRFARSVAQLAEFFDLCDKRKVRIRVDRDQIDTSTATGKLVGNVLASLAQFEADIASERVRDAFIAKRAKDPEWAGPGSKPYGGNVGEDPMVIVAAFRETGSFDGAAKLLNSRGVPSRFSKGHYWSGSVVSSIVRAHAPDETGPTVRRGAPAGRRSFRFAALIECSTCGKLLTGSRDKRRDEVRYACSRARQIPHARGWVNEAKLLPVVRAEAERASAAVRRLQVGSADDEAALLELAAERDRVYVMRRKNRITEAVFDTAMEELDAQEHKLSALTWIKRVAIAPDTETGEPAKVNAYLRRLFSRVVVDMSEPGFRGPSKWTPTLDFEWRDQKMRDGADAPVLGKIHIKGGHADVHEA